MIAEFIRLFSSFLERTSVLETEQVPVVLASPRPHPVLRLPFVCGKFPSKSKFNQRNEKCWTKENSQRRLNNSSAVIKRRQGPLILSQGP